MTGKVKIGRVEVEIEDVWEAITDKLFLDELEHRIGRELIDAWLEGNADERGGDAWGDEPEPALDLDEWNMDALRQAIHADDGRRAIDILRRALA